MADSVGRPTIYTDEIAQEICKVVSCSSKGLKPLCKENDHWPCEWTIRLWIRTKDQFSRMYAQAKLDQADLLAEEIIEIADNTSMDTIFKEDEDGYQKEVCNHEWINRSRLRVDTRKWLAAKLAPRIYSERVASDTTVTLKQHEDDLKELE